MCIFQFSSSYKSTCRGSYPFDLSSLQTMFSLKYKRGGCCKNWIVEFLERHSYEPIVTLHRNWSTSGSKAVGFQKNWPQREYYMFLDTQVCNHLTNCKLVQLFAACNGCFLPTDWAKQEFVISNAPYQQFVDCLCFSKYPSHTKTRKCFIRSSIIFLAALEYKGVSCRTRLSTLCGNNPALLKLVSRTPQVTKIIEGCMWSIEHYCYYWTLFQITECYVFVSVLAASLSEAHKTRRVCTNDCSKYSKPSRLWATSKMFGKKPK